MRFDAGFRDPSGNQMRMAEELKPAPGEVVTPSIGRRDDRVLESTGDGTGPASTSGLLWAARLFEFSRGDRRRAGFTPLPNGSRVKPSKEVGLEDMIEVTIETLKAPRDHGPQRQARPGPASRQRRTPRRRSRWRRRKSTDSSASRKTAWRRSRRAADEARSAPPRRPTPLYAPRTTVIRQRCGRVELRDRRAARTSTPTTSKVPSSHGKSELAVEGRRT